MSDNNPYNLNSDQINLLRNYTKDYDSIINDLGGPSDKVADDLKELKNDLNALIPALKQANVPNSVIQGFQNLFNSTPQELNVNSLENGDPLLVYYSVMGYEYSGWLYAYDSALQNMQINPTQGQTQATVEELEQLASEQDSLSYAARISQGSVLRIKLTGHD